MGGGGRGEESAGEMEEKKMHLPRISQDFFLMQFYVLLFVLHVRLDLAGTHFVSSNSATRDVTIIGCHVIPYSGVVKECFETCIWVYCVRSWWKSLGPEIPNLGKRSVS